MANENKSIPPVRMRTVIDENGYRQTLVAFNVPVIGNVTVFALNAKEAKRVVFEDAENVVASLEVSGPIEPLV